MSHSSKFIEAIIGASPFSFGSWFHQVEDNWNSHLPAPDAEDYRLTVRCDDQDLEEGNLSKEVRLTGTDLQAAAQKIVDGQVDLASSYVHEIRLALQHPDDADVDAIGADAVLQVAIYGDVIYG